MAEQQYETFVIQAFMKGAPGHQRISKVVTGRRNALTTSNFYKFVEKYETVLVKRVAEGLVGFEELKEQQNGSRSPQVEVAEEDEWEV